MTRGLIVGLLAWLGASTALAQSGPLWDRGVQQRAEGRDAEALETFQLAHADSGSMATLAQVALAEQALGRWGAAHRHLERALAQPDAWVTQNRGALEQALAEIVRHTGTLVVTVDHAGATIVVEGEDVGRSPIPAGVHVTGGRAVTLRVSRGGATEDRSVQVPIGGTVTEAVSLGAAGGGGGGGGLVVAGGVLLGVGVAAAVAMGVTWALREDAAQTYNSSACDPAIGMTRDQVCGPDAPGGPDYRTEVETLTGVTVGLGVGALVLAGVGAALLGVGASSGESASLACVPTPGGLGCRGRF